MLCKLNKTIFSRVSYVKKEVVAKKSVSLIIIPNDLNGGFHMSNDIGWNGYKVVDVIEEEHSVLVYVQPEKETRKCPNCDC